MTRPPKGPPPEDRAVIGWREYVDLPEWGLAHIKAKADTGARSSAIDVADIEELPDDRVRFVVIADRAHPDRRTTVEARIVRRTRVKSSFGQTHDRFFVSTMIRVGDVEVEAELGLVCRKQMLCRMLLGRKMLQGHFVVDPGRRYVRSRVRRRRTASPPPSDQSPTGGDRETP